MSKSYGNLPGGEAVEAWELQGEQGLSLEAITYGGIVTRLLVPDRNGDLADVVLGYDHLEPYLRRHPYFGSITGRVAGRISKALLKLEGIDYPLAANDGRNHLHGGWHGLDRRLWKATPVVRSDAAPSLQLNYVSPHGEENYPGEVHFKVTYTVTAGNAFIIDTEATTDRATPICLTHHSYFNLGGESSGTIAEHEVQISADTYFPTDADLSLLDQEQWVTNRPNDLTHFRRVGDVQREIHLGHGDLYRLRRADPLSVGTELVPAAHLRHPKSGRTLKIQTTERCLQFYTGVMLSPGDPVGKSGKPYGALAGLCLECQDYPNGVAVPHLGDIVIHPDRPYRHTAIYSFSNY